jgi:hypothetical protein
MDSSSRSKFKRFFLKNLTSHLFTATFILQHLIIVKRRSESALEIPFSSTLTAMANLALQNQNFHFLSSSFTIQMWKRFYPASILKRKKSFPVKHFILQVHYSEPVARNSPQLYHCACDHNELQLIVSININIFCDNRKKSVKGLVLLDIPHQEEYFKERTRAAASILRSVMSARGANLAKISQ